MSDVQETPVAAATAETTVPEVVEPQQTTTTEQVAATTEIAPLAEDKKDEIAPVEEKKDDATPAVEKAVEPITEGLLSYKGPGLLRAIVPSKREFWLSDEAVSPLDMSSYLRGEKPEVGNPVVAWASQTGKGLLFFNKKGNTNKKQPGGVFALYDATELRKQAPHEITFKLNGHEHQLKAATDAERDGWYISLEKAVELGKASKESIQDSEGYKMELEKLNKPPAAAVAAAAAAKRSQSQPKKSNEGDKAEDAARDESEASDEDKKKQKNRSTSRGMFNRLKGKKEEVEQKKEEKKEEEKAEETKEDDKTAEVAGGAAAAATVGGAVAAVEEEKKDTPEETAATADEAKTEEKPKASKRTSIFGKMSGWGKSPAKEKDQKEVEPKEEAKEPNVSENPPQLPESAATEATETTPIVVEESKPAEEEKAEEIKPAKEESATPGKEKKAFLSGFSFSKRGRSVSPSQNVTEAPAKEETAEADKPEETVAESAAVDATPVVVESADKPEEKTEESPKAEATPSKRGSVFGSLGRRASQAIKGFQAPKKENATPKPTEETKEDAEPTTETAEEPKTKGESQPVEEPAQPQIGDVVPEAVNVGQPQQTPVISASA